MRQRLASEIRLQDVAATRGLSWTDASLEAGFADAAHFTRTCRRVFGIAPTMLAFEPGL